MGPVTSAAMSSSKAWSWTSPLPYVFGGLGVILGLIAVALLVLACSRRKSSSDERGAVLPCVADKPTSLCPEPKIVVVMAGDDVPTFLAKPLPMADTGSFQQQA